MFCDSTTSLDRHNLSVFLLSTTTPVGAVPLAAVVTYDEQEETITQAMELLKSILPQHAFFGKGPQQRLFLVMTDDSSPGHEALSHAWKSATLLLYTFHFLQRCWTWLHDAKHGVHNKEHNTVLISKVEELVYEKTEKKLELLYKSLQSHEVATKYSQFISHMLALWPHWKEWAHCYRQDILMCGNNNWIITPNLNKLIPGQGDRSLIYGNQ